MENDSYQCKKKTFLNPKLFILPRFYGALNSNKPIKQSLKQAEQTLKTLIKCVYH